MGALQPSSTSSMIKALVLLSVAALAMGTPEPEAKPSADPYYGYYGLGHYRYAGYPYAYGGYYYGNNGLRHYGYAGYPYAYAGYGHYYGKRSAEATPAAKPEPYYGYFGLGHYGYAGYPYAYGAVVYGKRSAEAAPAAEPSADPYYGY